MKKIPYYDFDKIQDRTLDIILFVTYFLYFLLVLGVYFISPQYINLLHNIVKIYICFFLIYRFNPWRITKCNHLDKRIAFSAGFFLLSTTIFENILAYFISKTETHVEKVRRAIITNFHPSKKDTTSYNNNSNSNNNNNNNNIN
jgi:hypothetical protein